MPDNDFYTHALQNCLQHQTTLMQMHQLPNNEPVWVRKIGPRHSIWGYRLLGLVSRISGIHLLTPVPNLGGSSALQTEIKRIQALSAADICVPRILAQQPEAIMISHLGPKTLEQEWRSKKHKPEILLQRWQLGLNAISKVHQQQQYLSETFARNMIFINEQQIGFIDFEDDPATVLSPTQCHARDWLCYLHSGAKMMIHYQVEEQAKQIWHETLQNQPQTVYRDIQKSLRKIGWMRNLNASLWGTDTLKLAAMARFA